MRTKIRVGHVRRAQIYVLPHVRQSASLALWLKLRVRP